MYCCLFMFKSNHLAFCVTRISVPIRTPSALNSSNPEFWIKFNLDGTGFYRVNYPLNMWRRLSDVLSRDRTVRQNVAKQPWRIK